MREKIIRKIVHEEEYKNHSIEISARFVDSYGIKLNNKWHNGAVYIEGVIRDSEHKERCRLSVDNNHPFRDYDESPYAIMYHSERVRYGFLKLKSYKKLIHISDEYERVLPLFIKRCKDEVDRLVREQEMKNYEQNVTDGLPDSLKEL